MNTSQTQHLRNIIREEIQSIISERRTTDFVLRIDGDHETTLGEFMKYNPDLPREEAKSLADLRVGDTTYVGGGAAATFEIERIK